jgi:hypothetical protein
MAGFVQDTKEDINDWWFVILVVFGLLVVALVCIFFMPPA